MHRYTISISKTAQKQLDKLSDSTAAPIIDAISGPANNPRPNGCKKLKGRSGYRIRKGDFRIIYDIFDNILLINVIAVGDRKEIYD